MQKVKKFMNLPISGSGCLSAKFLYNDTDGCLEFKYSDGKTGKPSIGQLKFPHVMSFRFRDEMRSLGFFSESYDSVAEVLNSEWLAELEKIEPAKIHKLWKRRHFAVFLSSCGFFELIADDCDFFCERE
ncbi:MAG: hypothetical protein ACKVP0_04495 [Pirellulaceae bacterium]